MKRKILSIILVVLMMFALLIPSVAQTTVTITDGNVNATYEAYRLLELTTSPIPNYPDPSDPNNYNYSYTVNATYREVLTEVIRELIGDPMFPYNYNSPNPTEFDKYDIDPIIDYIYTLEGNESQIRIFADAVYKAISEKLGQDYGFNRPGSMDNGNSAIELIPDDDYAVIDRQYPDNEIKGELKDGYWLIVETTESIPDGEKTARSLVILDTAGIPNIEIKAKTKVPTVQKYVFDDILYDTLPSIHGWGKIGDYGVGDEIPFLLIGTLPENFEAYQSYWYEFQDELQGLTYTDLSMRVFIDTTGDYFENYGFEIQNIPPNLIELYEHSNDYMFSNQGDSFNVKIENLKALDYLLSPQELTQDSKIYVYYTATLNTSYIPYNYGHVADMGLPGNENTVILRYSNDIYNNDIHGMNSLGYTPSDSVKVFTYGIDLQKIDEIGDPLSGAAFILYRGTHDTIYFYLTNNDGWVENNSNYDLSNIETDPGIFIAHGENINDSDFPFLDAGEYYLYEIKAPDGYNRLKVPTPVIIKPHYEDMEYDDYRFVDTLTNLDNASGGNYSQGLVGAIIQNKPGILLPTTGGIGTTILYIGGTVLLLGSVFGLAIYLMINSRRRSVRRK